MANPFVICQKNAKKSLFKEFFFGLGGPNKFIFAAITFVAATFELCVLVWTKLYILP